MRDRELDMGGDGSAGAATLFGGFRRSSPLPRRPLNLRGIKMDGRLLEETGEAAYRAVIGGGVRRLSRRRHRRWGRSRSGRHLIDTGEWLWKTRQVIWGRARGARGGRPRGAWPSKTEENRLCENGGNER